MRPSTEEFLYFLLWTAESLARPTWRNLHDSFESWAWRSGLGRRIAELERMKLLEKAPGDAQDAVVRLTTTGQTVALGGRLPGERWKRHWDGNWRMVLFDIPQHQKAVRMRLWRYLKSQGYGYLQNSVWVTPDPIFPSGFVEAADLPSVEAMILMEGRPCGGETDADVVQGAWGFPKINALYERSIALLENVPAVSDWPRLRRWARHERLAWKEALRSDPLLPERLAPRGYLGFKAWDKRNQVITRLAGALASAA